ncbi:MAG: response regulator transcription factor [Bacteroidota bacterium]
MIRLLVVHETKLMADALANALEADGDIRVIGHAALARDAVRHLDESRCDVVLINALMPDTEAFEVLGRLKGRYTALQVVVMGVPDHPDHILPFLECGADGYVLQKADTQTMIRTIRAVHRGERPLSTEVTTAVLERLTKLSAFCEDVVSTFGESPLTERERDVLQCLASDLSNAEIAEELDIGVGTVKSHVHNILTKLNVASRYEAARYAPLITAMRPEATLLDS